MVRHRSQSTTRRATDARFGTRAHGAAVEYCRPILVAPNALPQTAFVGAIRDSFDPDAIRDHASVFGDAQVNVGALKVWRKRKGRDYKQSRERPLQASGIGERPTCSSRALHCAVRPGSRCRNVPSRNGPRRWRRCTRARNGKQRHKQQRNRPGAGMTVAILRGDTDHGK
jgi:hypothetical protein